jgi:hypothetical protein
MLVKLELLPPVPTTVLPHTSVPVEVGAVQEICDYRNHRRWRGEDHIYHNIELWCHGEENDQSVCKLKEYA